MSSVDIRHDKRNGQRNIGCPFSLRLFWGFAHGFPLHVVIQNSPRAMRDQTEGVVKLLADVDQARYDAYLRTSMAFNLQLKELAMDLPDNLNKFPNKFPDGWTDPLELYGERLPELKAAGCNLDKERNTMKELVQKYDARSVWGNRHRLASVAKAMRDYPRK